MSQRLDIYAASPSGMKALGGVYGHLTQAGLPHGVVDLVFLRVSLINGCAFCVDMHSRDLLKGGLSPEKLALIPVWQEAGALFTDQEKAALRWAETVTGVAGNPIPDAEFAAARQHFSESQLTDLTIAVGLINAYNFLGVGFRLTPAAAK